MEKEKIRKYYLTGDKPANKIILRNAKREGHVIYGARALNAHLPSHLDRQTEDWDVYSNKPRITAQKVEKKLDKRYGGDYYYLRRAKYERTTKVVNRVTERNIADYTKPEKKVRSKKVRGAKYVTLSYIKKGIKKTLKDKKSKFRWKKDKEALQRINIYEDEKRKRKKKAVKKVKVGKRSLFSDPLLRGVLKY